MKPHLFPEHSVASKISDTISDATSRANNVMDTVEAKVRATDVVETKVRATDVVETKVKTLDELEELSTAANAKLKQSKRTLEELTQSNAFGVNNMLKTDNSALLMMQNMNVTAGQRWNKLKVPNNLQSNLVKSSSIMPQNIARERKLLKKAQEQVVMDKP